MPRADSHRPRAGFRRRGAALAAWSWAAVGFYAFGASACAPKPGVAQAPCVAVREALFRSDAYPLPLQADARSELVLFLRVGANRDGIDDGQPVTEVYPDAEVRWGGLLDALQDAANVELADMSNGTYRAWFQAPAWRQVVDSRDERPNLACPPFVFQQDRLEWIFKCGDGGKLAELIVQLRSAQREEAP